MLIGAGWLLGGCATSPAARPAIATEPWREGEFVGRRITTEHFELISMVDDAELEAALPAFLEAAHRRYVATLPPPDSPVRRLTTYLFRSRSDWARYTSRRFPARFEVYARIRAGGFTEGDTSFSFYVSRSATLATLAHEGWHQYLGAHVSTPVPAWLNEGFACLHEALEFGGRRPRFTPKRNTLRINSLREAVQTDSVLPLSDLIQTDAGGIISRGHSRLTQTYYAQAWALIRFLQAGDGGRHAGGLRRLLADLADGTFAVRVSAAQLTSDAPPSRRRGEAVFMTYFDRTPRQLDDAYFDYLVRLTGF